MWEFLKFECEVPRPVGSVFPQRVCTLEIATARSQPLHHAVVYGGAFLSDQQVWLYFCTAAQICRFEPLGILAKLPGTTCPVEQILK